MRHGDVQDYQRDRQEGRLSVSEKEWDAYDESRPVVASQNHEDHTDTQLLHRLPPETKIGPILSVRAVV